MGSEPSPPFYKALTGREEITQLVEAAESGWLATAPKSLKADHGPESLDCRSTFKSGHVPKSLGRRATSHFPRCRGRPVVAYGAAQAVFTSGLGTEEGRQCVNR